jgi:hypothetical protein
MVDGGGLIRGVQLGRDLPVPQRRRSSGGASTYGECFGALSWYVADGAHWWPSRSRWHLGSASVGDGFTIDPPSRDGRGTSGEFSILSTCLPSPT